MPDLTLAEYNGNFWLVGGEEHIDDLMLNALPAGLTIQLVPCERKMDVHAHWVRLGGDPEEGREPWMIHPQIARRALGAPPTGAVLFAAWSVQVGEDGQRAIAEAVAWAASNPHAPVLLDEYLDEDALAAEAGLAAVRMQMVEAILLKSVAPARLVRRRRSAEGGGFPAGGGRIDIILSGS